MLVVETIGRIRREHFQKGKSIKEIALARDNQDENPATIGMRSASLWA